MSKPALLYRPEIFPDECIVGYLLRCASFNGFGSLSAFAKYLGLDWKNHRIPVRDLMLGKTSLAGGLAKAGLSATQGPLAQHFADLRSPQDTPFVVSSTPVFCRQCFHDQPYIRASWALSPVVACPLHGEVLELLPSSKGQSSRWYGRPTDLFSLDRSKKGVQAIRAEVSSVRMSAFFGSFVSGVIQHPEVPLLKGLSLLESITAINTLSAFVSSVQPDLFEKTGTNREIENRYSQAWMIAEDWPDALFELLSTRDVGEVCGGVARRTASTSFKDLNQLINRRLQSPGVLRVAEGFTTYMEARRLGGRQSSKTENRSVEQNLAAKYADKKSVARIAKVRPETISKLCDLGRITSVIHGRKILYSINDAERLRNTRATNFSLREAATALGISAHQTRLLLDDGLLLALERPSPEYRGWLVSRESCDSLLHTLQCVLQESAEEPDDQAWWSLKQLSVRGWSIADVVRGCLSRRIACKSSFLGVEASSNLGFRGMRYCILPATSHARDREELKKELLCAEGGCHELSDLAKQTGHHMGEIESLEKDLRIFSVPDGDRILFPMWQFEANGRPYPGLAGVLAAWKAENPYLLLAFFIDTHEALSRVRPLDLLRAGDIEALLNLVRYENAANGLVS